MNQNPSFTVFENSCRDLAELRAKLRRKMELKSKAQVALDSEHNPGLRDLQDQCNAARAALLANLAVSREMFVSPKTREFHGITVGYEKDRDSVVYPPEEILLPRIEAMLPTKQADTVLDRSVKIIKAAFKKLPREILQKLGCSMVKGADQAIVRANDDDIEALVKKALGEHAMPNGGEGIIKCRSQF